jgi:Fe-S cluster assembly iron-binding protein IscA
MKIEVTNEAKNEITKVLANEKNTGKLLRIYIAGYG